VFGIASIIIDYLKESNLIQEDVVNISVKEKSSILIPSDSLAKILKVNKTQNHNLPLRIPMIVKPKKYSRELINGVLKERLGGYLLNDERVTDPMIIPK